GPVMPNGGRWYPTTLAMRNGDVLVVGGDRNGSGDPNTIPDVWQFGAGIGSIRQLTTASRPVALYPMLFQAPDGRAFMAGPEAQSAFLNTSGTGSWQNGPQSHAGFRDYGSAVEYEPGKILLIGGGAPTASTETIDLNQANPQWVSAGNMNYARRQLNATILADGKVLVTGGTNAAGFNNAAGAIYASELWSPGAAWTVVRPQNEKRLYHSTAVLLKDGSVLSIGGGQPVGTGVPDSDHYSAQIYYPPYFYKGTRPTITSAPTTLTYGQSFAIQTPDAQYITQVTLVRLSSVTHAFNQSQRINKLTPTIGSGQVTVTVPPNSQITPGPYFLHVLNGASVPSIAKVVYIQ
ncbi:MAG TPA: galactose oxidase early set domain-containing protein, partial [Thermoanaerobaculia bacterium]|nr:galactose oxidase early set domain-containing protein [Thermoanaerobaculia bacterium]